MRIWLQLILLDVDFQKVKLNRDEMKFLTFKDNDDNIFKKR